ncbi:hypothetical protein E2C01_053778 [Portunus trituberculatus]|uniref:Uncharacterized protein n=1 Tax=Portunus trituberculatus TaxID=210409 RepID=A0A5B7GHN3_PORTR|nr:hypothetical protein [Portunus trituberculatus]
MHRCLVSAVGGQRQSAGVRRHPYLVCCGRCEARLALTYLAVRMPHFTRTLRALLHSGRRLASSTHFPPPHWFHSYALGFAIMLV